MALYTSVNQLPSPKVDLNKPDLKKDREFDVEYHNDEFPYIIINDLFDEESLKLVWEELDFLCYEWKNELDKNPQSSGKWGRNITSRREMWLEAIYTNPVLSNIIRANALTFDKNPQKDKENGFLEILHKHDHWFFKKCIIMGRHFLLNYYEDRNYYLPHSDEGLMTCLHWFYKEPKSFEGGEFVFTDYDKKIELASNKMIIFPSMIKHEVTPIIMKEEDKGKKLGRWCITTFLADTDMNR